MKFATVAVVLLLCVSTSLAAQTQPPSTAPDVRSLAGPRVRANDGRTAAILLDGLSRSETLRALVDEIEQSDVIVYLEIQWNLRRGLAGSLNWVAATGSFRYVRISLSPDVIGDVMVATLGHELQHAVEIARERSIISSATLASYYAKNGLSVTAHWNGWDTLAARQTGDEVRRELAGIRTVRVAESIQDFNFGQHKFHRAAKVFQHPDVTVAS